MLLYRDSFSYDNAGTLDTYLTEFNYTGNVWEGDVTDWDTNNGILRCPDVGKYAKLDLGYENVDIAVKLTLEADASFKLYVKSDLGVTDYYSVLISATGAVISDSLANIHRTTHDNLITIGKEFTVRVRITSAMMYVIVDGTLIVSLKNPATKGGTYVIFESDTVDALAINNITINTSGEVLTPQSSWLTRANIRTRVSRAVKEASLVDADLDAYIAEAYDEIFYEERWKERKSRELIPLIPGILKYELPVDVDDIYALRGQNWSLVKRSDMEYHKGRAWSTSSSSVGVRFEGRHILLDQIVTSEYGDLEFLEADYYCDLSVVNTNGEITVGNFANDTDYPLLHPALHKVLALKAAILAIEDSREEGTVQPQKLRRYQLLYQKAKQKALGLDKFPSQMRILR